MTLYLTKTFSYILCTIIRASMPENLSLGFANNKGADQPAQMRRLVSTFVILLLEHVISEHATNENSNS